MTLSLVFPAANEAGSIVGVLEDFSRACRRRRLEHELIVVDDGSVDGTADEVRRFARERPEVRLIVHDRNRGYGAALRSGFAAATKDFVFVTDADGQFTADDLTRTLALADARAIVVGYRLNRAEGLGRRLNAWLWGRCVRLVVGLDVRDLNCAWKLFPRTLLEVPLLSDGAFISAELLAAARRQGLTFRELPVRHQRRENGRATGAQPRVILHAFRELYRFKRR